MESFFKIKTFKSLKKVLEFFSNIKNFKSRRKVMQHCFSIKIFKAVTVSFFSIKNCKSRKWWSSISALITLKVVRKWRSRPFFSVKNFNSCKVVMEFFLSFKSFKSHEKVTESFFSGHTSLSFHMKHKFPGIIFSLSVPTEFLWLY